MTTTIKDIARALHVSPAAVSLALNGKPGVSESVRKQIIQKATELHYVPRKSREESHKPTVRYVIYVSEGSVVNSISFHSLVLKGIESHAKTLNYNVLISYLYENRMVEEQLAELKQNIDGMLILGTEFQEDSQLCEALTLIDQTVCPVILLDYALQHTTLDCIATDNYHGAYQAISYLAEHGHTQIGYFSSSDYITNFGERAKGVSDAVKDHPAVTLHRIPTRFSTNNAFTDISAWLQKQERKSLPTGYFADSDIIAFGALQAFSSQDIRTPEDVSVIGFDDMPECGMIFPPLTTIHVPKEFMGIEAMLLLDRRIRERRHEPGFDLQDYPAVHLTLSNYVKERSSVRRI